MTITRCGICEVHAVGRVERFVLFGHLKAHMSTVCKSCRSIEKNNRRKSKENTFRDRIETCETQRPRAKVNAKNLMRAFTENERHKERLALHEFIGL
jgi:hypothetical protein